MQTFKLLFGFTSEKTSDSIEKSIKAWGYRVETSVKPTKQLMKEYVVNNQDLNAIILKEYLDGGGQWGVQELIELANSTRAKIVIVLSSKHCGKESMRELYSEGIINGVFSDNKVGASPENLAKLAVKGRTGAEAKEYYRIGDGKATFKLLTASEQTETLRFLLDETQGVNIMDRFVTISRWITPYQYAYFINHLPEEVKQILAKYVEYYDIYNRMARQGLLDGRLKVPKELTEGLTKDKKASREETKAPMRPAKEKKKKKSQIEEDFLDFASIVEEDAKAEDAIGPNEAETMPSSEDEDMAFSLEPMGEEDMAVLSDYEKESTTEILPREGETLDKIAVANVGISDFSSGTDYSQMSPLDLINLLGGE